jgi:hypothetical protein
MAASGNIFGLPLDVAASSSKINMNILKPRVGEQKVSKGKQIWQLPTHTLGSLWVMISSFLDSQNQK